MSHARTQHPNAVLTPNGRRRMVGCVLERGWTIEATTQRFQVDAKTVRKWRDRFRVEGSAGLLDRSSRPRRSPNRTPRSCRRMLIRLRKQHRWGADHIAYEVGIAASTGRQCCRCGCGQLRFAARRVGRPRPSDEGQGSGERVPAGAATREGLSVARRLP